MPTLQPVCGSTSTVHAVPTDDAKGGQTLAALCGRKIKVTTTYYPEDWPKMAEQWHRIGRTHITYVCGDCAKRSL
jgi:hypothetical protein